MPANVVSSIQTVGLERYILHRFICGHKNNKKGKLALQKITNVIHLFKKKKKKGVCIVSLKYFLNVLIGGKKKKKKKKKAFKKKKKKNHFFKKKKKKGGLHSQL